MSGEKTRNGKGGAGRLRTWALLLVPVAFFALLEGTLRIVGYGDAYPLFEPMPGFPGYVVPNPDVGRRYFVQSDLVPGPPMDVFRARKPENGFRVVVQGASSAAGFPYGHGGSFARMLEQRLSMTLPNREVEVINTGIDAVSSYTLLDFADEIADVEPDAVLIYAGHNEYYGALGVGSTQSLGRARWLVRLMLALDGLRTVQALRDLIVGLGPKAAPDDADPGTLMEAMARDRRIVHESDAYRAGVRQFESNVGDLACRYRDRGIPTFIATVVSNDGAIPPFVSGLAPDTVPATWEESRIEARRLLARGDTLEALAAYDRLLGMDDVSADARFEYARALYAAGRTAEARDAYVGARDRDQLPFRAPSAINEAVRTIAARCGATVVDVRALFEQASPGGIPGSALLLEHVHPNVDGYFLIAEAFYRALGVAALPEPWSSPVPPGIARSQVLVTALDSAVASIHVRRLLDNWPYRSSGDPHDETLRIRNFTDSLALDVIRGSKTWTEATAALGSWHQARGEWPQALRAALVIAQDQPFRPEPRIQVGRVLAASGRLEDALASFERANVIGRTPEGLRLEGQMLTRLGRADDGLVRLERAHRLVPDDPATLYDLGVAYLAADRPEAAREAATRLLELRPGDAGGRRLLERVGG